MKVTSDLYGVQFKANTTLPVWQPDVQGYDVGLDTASGKYLSVFTWISSHARTNTNTQLRSRCRGRIDGCRAYPISVLVTNFNREGFDQRELETLFHRFGHIM